MSLCHRKLAAKNRVMLLHNISYLRPSTNSRSGVTDTMRAARAMIGADAANRDMLALFNGHLLTG